LSGLPWNRASSCLETTTKGPKGRYSADADAELEAPLFHGCAGSLSGEESKAPLLAQRTREKWGTRHLLLTQRSKRFGLRFLKDVSEDSTSHQREASGTRNTFTPGAEALLLICS